MIRKDRCWRLLKPVLEIIETNDKPQNARNTVVSAYENAKKAVEPIVGLFHILFNILSEHISANQCPLISTIPLITVPTA